MDLSCSSDDDITVDDDNYIYMGGKIIFRTLKYMLVKVYFHKITFII